MDLNIILQQLRQVGKTEQAREAWVSLAAQYPQEPQVQYGTACIHDSMGLESLAVPYYLAAINLGLAPEDLRGAYLGLGSTYRTLGQFEESKHIFECAMAAFPEALELRVFLAMTLYNLADHHAAMSLLLDVIADTSADEEIQRYQRAIRLYAQDLERQW
ncbi:hypothetical protein AwEntero_24250 [Enterobacterales bacterium]|nr:hypothetical protein AwEntero_24250 [Enterobacterales bacterium]